MHCLSCIQNEGKVVKMKKERNDDLLSDWGVTEMDFEVYFCPLCGQSNEYTTELDILEDELNEDY